MNSKKKIREFVLLEKSTPRKKLQIFIRVHYLQKSLMADEYRIFSVILTSNSQNLATKA